MRSYSIGVFGVCLFFSVAMAQTIQVGMNGGYGLGTGLGLVGQNRTSTSDTSLEDVYGGLGKGVKIGLDVDFFFDENIGFMVSSGYSFLGGYSLKNIWETSPGVQQSQEYRYSASYIPLNAGLKLRKNLGGVTPYIYLAPGLYFPMMNEKYIVTPDSTVFDATFKFSMGFGFASGIGATVDIGGGSKLTLEVSPTYAFVNITEITTERNGIKSTTIYKNNTVNFPANPPANTTYVHGQPRRSLSSICFKAGICFGM